MGGAAAACNAGCSAGRVGLLVRCALLRDCLGCDGDVRWWCWHCRIRCMSGCPSLPTLRVQVRPMGLLFTQLEDEKRAAGEGGEDDD